MIAVTLIAMVKKWQDQNSLPALNSYVSNGNGDLTLPFLQAG